MYKISYNLVLHTQETAFQMLQILQEIQTDLCLCWQQRSLFCLHHSIALPEGTAALSLKQLESITGEGFGDRELGLIICLKMKINTLCICLVSSL